MGCKKTYAILGERKIAESQLTKRELAICKAVGAKWITMDRGSKQIPTTHVDLWSAEPDEDEGYYVCDNPNDFLGNVSMTLFPSIKPGDCIKL